MKREAVLGREGYRNLRMVECLRHPVAWFAPRAGRRPGGELVSTGVVKQLGACRGVGPRKTLTLANLTANDETYALAA